MLPSLAGILFAAIMYGAGALTLLLLAWPFMALSKSMEKQLNEHDPADLMVANKPKAKPNMVEGPGEWAPAAPTIPKEPTSMNPREKELKAMLPKLRKVLGLRTAELLAELGVPETDAGKCAMAFLSDQRLADIPLANHEGKTELVDDPEDAMQDGPLHEAAREIAKAYERLGLQNTLAEIIKSNKPIKSGWALKLL